METSEKDFLEELKKLSGDFDLGIIFTIDPNKGVDQEFAKCIIDHMGGDPSCSIKDCIDKLPKGALMARAFLAEKMKKVSEEE